VVRTAISGGSELLIFVPKRLLAELGRKGPLYKLEYLAQAP
jgi:hypothetical protein